VKRFTQKYREKKEKMYHELTFLPGEEGQVDWAHIAHPQLGKLYLFIYVLSYSRFVYAHLFPRMSFEFFIEGHLLAFDKIGGLPLGGRYDNLKSVILKREPNVQYNPRFLEFCKYYRLEIHLCNVCAGNEKGRVERAIRSLRESFFNILPHHLPLDKLNAELHRHCDNKNRKEHRATGKTPMEMLAEENLRKLPQTPWVNVMVHEPTKTTKTGTLIFETNHYSVPETLVGKSLSIYSSPSQIQIFYQGKCLAKHPRSFKRNQRFINPLHRSFPRLSYAAKLDRVYHLLQKMDPALETFLSQNLSAGENPKVTAYEIFRLFKHHSRLLLIGIAKECINRRSPRLSTFLSFVQVENEKKEEPVTPQNTALLEIGYTPRSLEVYND
jgi:hypothetical protein